MGVMVLGASDTPAEYRTLAWPPPPHPFSDLSVRPCAYTRKYISYRA